MTEDDYYKACLTGLLSNPTLFDVTKLPSDDSDAEAYISDINKVARQLAKHFKVLNETGHTAGVRPAIPSKAP